MSIDATTMR